MCCYGIISLSTAVTLVNDRVGEELLNGIFVFCLQTTLSIISPSQNKIRYHETKEKTKYKKNIISETNSV